MTTVTKRSGMTLFSDPACHYCHRVRIVLAEKGVTVDIEDIDPGNVSDELVELNPYATVPTLVDKDLSLYESKVMMEYLDERFPHPPLLPVYPVARAQSRLWMHRIEQDWSPMVDIIASGKNKEAAAKARKDLKDGLMTIAPIFSELPYFMSEEFTIVDCCLGPILWRLKSLEIELPKTKQTKPLFDYMERLFARESFQESLTEMGKEMNR